MKKPDKKKILFLVATKFAWLLILFFGKTARLSIRGRRHLRRVEASHRGFIICVWHGRMLAPIYVHRNQGVIAMVSEHEDGEMIAQTILRLGYGTVRGSSTRGGTKAFRQMLRELKNGRTCAILPDGPNGPRHEFKMGAVMLAQRSGAWLLPATFSAQRPITFRSWDRFTMWWPFSRVQVVYGEPISVPRELKLEQLEHVRRQVEQRMNQLVEQADAAFRK